MIRATQQSLNVDFIFHVLVIVSKQILVFIEGLDGQSRSYYEHAGRWDPAEVIDYLGGYLEGKSPRVSDTNTPGNTPGRRALTYIPSQIEWQKHTAKNGYISIGHVYESGVQTYFWPGYESDIPITMMQRGILTKSDLLPFPLPSRPVIS